MVEYILSRPELIRPYESFINESYKVIADILSDKLYVKVEPDLIKLEVEFRKNIVINRKMIDDRLSEEIRKLLINTNP